MCASSLAANVRPFDTARLKAIGGAGLAAASVGLLGFGVAHALLITPIWSQLLGGMPFVVIGGIALACGFDHLPATVRNRGLRSGVQFGAVMIGTLVPATSLDAALRIAGLRRADAVETAIALALAAATGAAAGWIWTRQPRGAVAFGAAALGLFVTTHGPLPIAQSPKGLWLSLAIAPVIVLGCVVIAAAHQRLQVDTP
jgi:hypothetical protein